MTYVIVAWAAATIGFVLGAAWTGLCSKNREIDRQLAGKVKESYFKAQQSGM
jgi:membrane associated rhomboid family serine protease